jgi:hypothetical protein
MAIAAVIKLNGSTLEQYDQALGDMGFTRFGVAAPGALFHWSTSTDEGLLVTEVWETPEAFEIFVGATLGPAIAKVGVTEMPEITFHEVHNFLTTPVK